MNVSINPMAMIYTAQRIEGFMCMPWLAGMRGNFLKDMHGFLRAGKIIAKETPYEGIEMFGAAFQALFTGSSPCGKVYVKC